MGIQDGARKAAVEAAAANGSAIVAGAIASAGSTGLDAAAVTAVQTDLDKLKSGDVKSVALTGTKLDAYCVTATGDKFISVKGTGTGCTNGTTVKP